MLYDINPFLSGHSSKSKLTTRYVSVSTAKVGVAIERVNNANHPYPELLLFYSLVLLGVIEFIR